MKLLFFVCMFIADRRLPIPCRSVVIFVFSVPQTVISFLATLPLSLLHRHYTMPGGGCQVSAFGLYMHASIPVRNRTRKQKFWRLLVTPTDCGDISLIKSASRDERFRSAFFWLKARRISQYTTPLFNVVGRN